LLGGFGSSEHVAIGLRVDLKDIYPNSSLLEDMGNVQFAHIIALAGDFYGVVNEPIAPSKETGGDEEEDPLLGEARFLKAFNTLAEGDRDKLKGIIAGIDKEYFAVYYGSLPNHCYSSEMLERYKELKSIKGDIDELLIDNSDHFSSNAQKAYLIGHELARKTAEKARREGNSQEKEKELKRAYAIDAFACHFLTDLFAAGHIRNQRGELELFLTSKLGLSSYLAKRCAAILTAAQHEQDGSQGLNICNQIGTMLEILWRWSLFKTSK